MSANESKPGTQFFVHVSVSRMETEHFTAQAVRSDYDYVFTMASDVPIDEMSQSAIYKQLIGGLNGLVNPATASAEVTDHAE